MMRSLRIIPFGGSLGSLNLSWVYSELAPQYPRIGRPSVDPVLMIRMLVVGYVFGIRSELA
jgi:transposase